MISSAVSVFGFKKGAIHIPRSGGRGPVAHSCQAFGFSSRNFGRCAAFAQCAPRVRAFGMRDALLLLGVGGR
jgi:hypothetical protein